MVIFIGTISIQQEKAHVHVQDMVPSSHTVWSTFKKASGRFIWHDENDTTIKGQVLGHLRVFDTERVMQALDGL